jgi:hypothetical protein
MTHVAILLMITGYRSVSVRILLFFTRSREAVKKAKDSPQSHRRKQKEGKELLKTSRSGRDRRRSGTNSFWFHRHTTEILVFLCASVVDFVFACKLSIFRHGWSDWLLAPDPL